LSGVNNEGGGNDTRVTSAYTDQSRRNAAWAGTAAAHLPEWRRRRAVRLSVNTDKCSAADASHVAKSNDQISLAATAPCPPTDLAKLSSCEQPNGVG